MSQFEYVKLFINWLYRTKIYPVFKHEMLAQWKTYDKAKFQLMIQDPKKFCIYPLFLKKTVQGKDFWADVNKRWLEYLKSKFK